MNGFLPRWLTSPFLALALLGSPGLLAQDTPLPDREGKRASTAQCAECHDRQHRRIRDGAHGSILRAEVLPGCETCHGPGAAHANDADNDPLLVTMPSLLSIEQQVALCGRCHGDQMRLHGGDPEGFRAAGLACTDCHSVHELRLIETAPGLRLARRADAAEHAERVGSARCIECHPLREELLQRSAHAGLAGANSEHGCEDCHGEGSLHAESGEGRLITRPDRAKDGAATCLGCHEGVDPVDFHWKDKKKPYLSDGLTCTSCHAVHAPVRAMEPGPSPTMPTNRLCAGCHAAAFATMPGSPHQPLGRFETPLERGCGACHAGSADHAQAGGATAPLTQWIADARGQAAVCLECHRSNESLAHVRRGDHLRHGVRCTDCHGPLHEAGRARGSKAQERCGSCHAAVAAEFRQPNHHPVPEGRMSCVDCHDVHGARATMVDRSANRGRCVECHAAYRGPFVFAHQADRRGGCTVCHTPHGSPTRRLLRQASVRQNCLQCHGDFPAFHDQTQGSVFTNCVRCHTQVHGSNHSRYLFR